MKTIEKRDIEQFASKLCGGTFLVNEVRELEYLVSSPKCAIRVLVQPRGGAAIDVINPRQMNERYSFLTLRHMRSARNTSNVSASPMDNVAAIFNKYFLDILNGDFNGLVDYRVTEELLNAFLPRMFSLKEDDPIRIKFHSFDGSWMADWKAR